VITKQLMDLINDRPSKLIFPNDKQTVYDAANEIQRLRSELREAQREICRLYTDPSTGLLMLPQEYAEIRGWKCYEPLDD
jgi:hypothetical protein